MQNLKNNFITYLSKVIKVIGKNKNKLKNAIMIKLYKTFKEFSECMLNLRNTVLLLSEYIQ